MLWHKVFLVSIVFPTEELVSKFEACNERCDCYDLTNLCTIFIDPG